MSVSRRVIETIERMVLGVETDLIYGGLTIYPQEGSEDAKPDYIVGVDPAVGVDCGSSEASGVLPSPGQAEPWIGNTDLW